MKKNLLFVALFAAATLTASSAILYTETFDADAPISGVTEGGFAGADEVGALARPAGNITIQNCRWDKTNAIKSNSGSPMYGIASIGRLQINKNNNPTSGIYKGGNGLQFLPIQDLTRVTLILTTGSSNATKMAQGIIETFDGSNWAIFATSPEIFINQEKQWVVTGFPTGTTTMRISQAMYPEGFADGTTLGIYDLKVEGTSVSPSSIDKLESSNMVAYVNGNQINFSEAAEADIYNVAGMRLASVNEMTVSQLNLNGGIYIMKATDSKGLTTTQKIVIE